MKEKKPPSTNYSLPVAKETMGKSEQLQNANGVGHNTTKEDPPFDKIRNQNQLNSITHVKEKEPNQIFFSESNVS
jgi:hypothetical protein